MTLVSAAGAHLYDDRGQRWLDAGVGDALVGYGNPQVAEAVAAQMTSTHVSRELRNRYIGRLLGKFPPQYSVCYLVNSLSEANELALRLARAHRRGKDVIVLDNASYGMTTSLANMSPAQYESRGTEKKFWVHSSRRDAADVAQKAREIESSGRGLCGFFAEGIFDDGFLRESYASVSAAGGLNVAIEAQTGMGRWAKHFGNLRDITLHLTSL